MSAQLYQLAQRFVGEIREVSGPKADPFILWCHDSTTLKATSDEVAWCSSFINRLAWLLRLPRSKSAAARSWLLVGTPVTFNDAQFGDVVILKRGVGEQPGPEVIAASGHVCLWAGVDAIGNGFFQAIGGNQSDGVTVARFETAKILGIRRLV